MENKTSIIIPTYNKSEFLNLTLAGFTTQTSKDFDIVVVDDGSMDNTKKVVDSYRDKLDIFYIYQENKGRSVARNTGLKNTNANNIIFCDDDRIPNKSFIEAHQTNRSQNLVTVGIKEKILVRYNPKLIWKEKSLTVLTNLIKISGKDFLNEDFFTEKDLINDFENIVNAYGVGLTTDNYQNVADEYGSNLEGFHFPWAIGTTANMSFIRHNIDDFLFDENYSSWGMEDTDFSYTLCKRGYRFKFINEAINYHQHHPSNFYLEKDSLNKNVRYFCQKHDDLSCYLFANLFGLRQLSIIELNELLNLVTEHAEEEGSLCETLKKLLTNTLY